MKAAPEEIRGIKRMWHVETDFFALAVFMIMLLKEHSLKKRKEMFREGYFIMSLFSVFSMTALILSLLQPRMYSQAGGLISFL